MTKNTTLLLFDVDDTLTLPRKALDQTMKDFLQKLRQSGLAVGIVGGSDLMKITEQLGADAAGAYDFVFSENGLVAHKGGQPLAKASLRTHLGKPTLQRLINFVLHYIADLDIPVKRGTFIEFRNGMLNVSPIGRNCSQEERDEFERKKMVEMLKERFLDLGLTYS